MTTFTGSLLFPAGRATTPALWSIGAQAFGENMQSQFFSIAAIFEKLGGIAGNPAAAALFTRGLLLGGQWRGLVFVVSSVSRAALTPMTRDRCTDEHALACGGIDLDRAPHRLRQAKPERSLKG